MSHTETITHISADGVQFEWTGTIYDDGSAIGSEYVQYGAFRKGREFAPQEVLNIDPMDNAFTYAGLVIIAARHKEMASIGRVFELERW